MFSVMCGIIFIFYLDECQFQWQLNTHRLCATVEVKSALFTV